MAHDSVTIPQKFHRHIIGKNGATSKEVLLFGVLLSFVLLSTSSCHPFFLLITP